MKFRRTFRFHGLKRPRIRQTWNKYNLYNLLENLRLRPVAFRTFFQQKWYAKALARGYHGEHIKERQWAHNMFTRRLNSVVDMDPRYMAAFDGAEQAAGRGRGRQPDPSQPQQLKPWAGTNQKFSRSTPYMHMTFAPMERRLDVAVFRAMFASSARQARQFVVHGAVTVNGKKMIYPGYLLNPGDMFQVDVDRVLYATGAKKRTNGAGYRARAAKAVEPAENAAESEEADAGAGQGDGAGQEAAASAAAPAAVHKRAVRELPYLAARAKRLLAVGADDLTVKRKKALRTFVKDARKWLAKAGAASAAPSAGGATPPPPSSDVVDRLADLLADLPALGEESGEAAEAAQPKKKKAGGPRPELTDEERARFQALVARDAENPHDPSKPYATPWRPRPFMAPFAFIPRYLEVNQNVCAAVYLRHPVARPGEAEVPTPFPQEISQLVFNWYLRRH